MFWNQGHRLQRKVHKTDDYRFLCEQIQKRIPSRDEMYAHLFTMDM